MDVIEITGARSEGNWLRMEEETEAAVAAGEHYWSVIIIFRCVDPTAQVILDQENLRSGAEVGCFICEEPFTPALLGTVCTGVPS